MLLRFFTLIFFLVAPQIKAEDKINSAIKFSIQKKVLSNGITVLVNESPHSQILSYQSWFRVGSKNEVPGKTGLAHFFEHLMFRGTPRFSSSQLLKIFEQNGISYNAMTTRDFTLFYEDASISKIEMIMDMESDRLKNLQINQENFEIEKKVVQEERLSKVTQPLLGEVQERFLMELFGKHFYAHPIVGFSKDLELLNLADALEFFNGYYTPSNLVLSISGGVSAENVFRMAEKYYGDIQKKTKSFSPILPEPILAERKITLTKNLKSKNTYLQIGYLGVKVGEMEALSGEFLEIILCRGKISRLYKKIVLGEAVANSLSCDYSNLAETGYFEFSLELKPNVTSEKAIFLIDSELQSLSLNLIPTRELEMSKRTLLRDEIDGLKTAQDRAIAMGSHEVITGSFENLFKDHERYQSLKAEDVRTFVQKIFNKNHRVILELKSK